MREWVVILPAAERVKLIASAKETLHHDSIGCCRRYIRRVLAKELEKPCRVGRGLGDIITCLVYPIHAQLLILLILLNIHSTVNFVD